MANTAIVGRVIGDAGLPVAGLTVTGFDADVWPFRAKLGEAQTAGDGRFRIDYVPEAYGPLERLPDLYIEVSDSSGVLAVTRETSDVATTEFDAGDIVLPRGNVSLAGRIVDAQGGPVPGVRVIGRDIDLIGEDRLGVAISGPDGRFSMAYPRSKYIELGDIEPDIKISITDNIGLRVLFESQEFRNVRARNFDLGDVVLQSNAPIGWAAQLDQAAAPFVSENNSTELLIDNDAAFRRMIEDIDASTTSIQLMQLDFIPSLVAVFAGELIPTNETAPLIRLADRLLAASRRGVQIRALLNNFAHDGATAFRRFLSNSRPNTITARSVDLGQPLHAKMIVIDEGVVTTACAYVIGSPFDQGYWDTSLHLLDDPRRGEGAVGIGRPIHDVSMRVRGGAIQHIGDYFRLVWNKIDSTRFRALDQLTPPAPSTGTGRQKIQVARSIPRSDIARAGEAGIFESYLRAFSNASNFVYIENQYFSSRLLTEAIKSTIEAKPEIQFIVLINQHPDIPTYKQWQDRRISQFGLNHPQIGFFSLWSTRQAAGKTELRNYYVHSKVAVADDSWATIGTANLDGISLEVSDELTGATSVLGGAVGALAAGLFGAVALPFIVGGAIAGGAVGGSRRSVELNLNLFDGIDGGATTGDVATLRRRLWSEHLDSVPQARPPDGWLGLWRNKAAENILALNRNSPVLTSRVLPYRSESGAVAQVAAMGVRNNRLRPVD
jgi:phosphatidylserine/phosphatidylglycerophosphate/cardiolipin synthase-like enzyme